MYANNIGTIVRIMLLSCHIYEKGKKKRKRERKRFDIPHLHTRKKKGGTERGVYMYTNIEGIFVYSVTILPPSFS